MKFLMENNKRELILVRKGLTEVTFKLKPKGQEKVSQAEKRGRVL